MPNSTSSNTKTQIRGAREDYKFVTISSEQKKTALESYQSKALQAQLSQDRTINPETVVRARNRLYLETRESKDCRLKY